jgi:hypothetical protein
MARMPARIRGGAMAARRPPPEMIGTEVRRRDRNGGGFAAGVSHQLAGEGLLDFEDGVDALSGDVQPGVVREDQRGVQVVVNGDIELAATSSVGVDDEGGRGAVEIAAEQIHPTLLASGAAGAAMLEGFADRQAGEHLFLNAQEDIS